MTAHSLAAAMTAVVLVSGCRASHDLAPADVSSYEQLVADLSGRLQSYCSSAQTVSSSADCTAALQQYVDHVRPDLAGMQPLAGSIDDYMMSMGGMQAGDMRCAMDAMSREVDRHAGVACASSDMGANRAEALNHCDQMQGYADHMRMRGAEAGGMMGAGMMSSGMMGGAVDGGWMMSDGGVMGWDHRMPGCAADGG